MTALSDYQFNREVGRGAYGVVHEVRHKLTNEVFAMKVINFPRTSDGLPQSVVREMGALMSIKKLNHANIIKLYDAFVSNTNNGNTTLSILYEKCDWDLHMFLENIPRSMGESQCKWFAYQMFAGLEFLHSNGIIHRDMKPQNILITKTQQLKIADFGLARNYSLHSTFTTTVVTLWYRAPELLLQCGYNTAVDLWSAGCIMVELFIREAIFPANTESEVLFMIFKKLGTPEHTDWPEDSVVGPGGFPHYPKRSVMAINNCMVNFATAVDLMDSILVFSAARRLTAKECLQHPWFSSISVPATS